MSAFSKFRMALMGVLTVMMAGVLGYRFFEDYTWFEALYMTTITLSTVGFQEVRPLSQIGRLLTIILLVSGLGVVLYTTVALAEIIVEGELQRFFGRRRMEKKIEALRDHYLVCGYGRIGEVICRELATKPTPFVIIEQQEERAKKGDEQHYLVLHDDATDEQVLMNAGVMRAKGLFATLSTDANNVFVTLTAKQLNPNLTIVARAEAEQSQKTLIRAGADKVISPYAMGGHRMAQAALRPAVVDVIDLATHHQSLEIQLEEIGVPPQSPCAGVVLRDSGLRERFGVIVVAIKRATGLMIFNPSPEERIDAGDRLVVLAEASRLKDVESLVGGEA
ncbi:MAG TPA: potassium channel protein [Candidatus Tectomicrobia bacterium]